MDVRVDYDFLCFYFFYFSFFLRILLYLFFFSSCINGFLFD